MADDPKKIIKLHELDDLTLDDTQNMLRRANDALVIHELRRVLERQIERDVVIEELRDIVDTLAVGHVMAIGEIKKLKNAHGVLVRQQKELHEKQELIMRTCDEFAERLDKEAEAREKLTSELEDKD